MSCFKKVNQLNLKTIYTVQKFVIVDTPWNRKIVTAIIDDKVRVDLPPRFSDPIIEDPTKLEEFNRGRWFIRYDGMKKVKNYEFAVISFPMLTNPSTVCFCNTTCELCSCSKIDSQIKEIDHFCECTEEERCKVKSITNVRSKIEANGGMYEDNTVKEVGDAVQTIGRKRVEVSTQTNVDDFEPICKKCKNVI
jgi:hypothetical protein